ncbi:MAG TPA: hypothetical protein DEB40_05325, partial [Elusimicrobia bacterium]|nr:hypothetical protein [Elusimicrobiota bacterium]
MTRMMLSLTILLACLGAEVRAAPAAAGGVVASGQAAGQEMTEDQFRQGLAQLKKYLERRGEDERFLDIFINSIQNAFADPDGDGRIAVARPVFDAFIRYEVAWARKTRDGKNPNVSREQLRREVKKADRLKMEFRAIAHEMSPAFYAAFQAAVKAVRRARPGQPSAGLFTGQTDDSYSHVDAGGADLQQGDAAAAAAQARQAIAEEPGNSEAHSLLAAAAYAQGRYAAAARAAAAALRLDPGNQQARAVLALSGSRAPRAPGPLAAAASAAAEISEDIAAPTEPVPASGALPAARAQNAPQSADLAGRAQAAIRSGDPLKAIGELNRAIALDPMNAQALNLRAIVEADGRHYADALQDINRSLMILPHSSASLDTKSMISNRAKDYAGALAAANEALRIDSRDAYAYFNRAHALAGQGDRDGALEALRQAAFLEPSYERPLQEARALLASADMTLLFPDREGLLSAACSRPVARRRASPFARFLRRSGIMPVVREIGSLRALGALGVFMAGP